MRMRISVFAAVACCVVSTASMTQAQMELEEIIWGGTTGNRNWHEGTNWVGGVVPNTLAPDPSLHYANLAVNLGSGLTVDLGATDARIARLKVGSQSGAVTTNVTSTGIGRLLFRNDEENVLTATEDADFDNSTTVNGRDFLIWQRGYGMTGQNINNTGDANNDGTVNGADLAIWQDQYGFGLAVISQGSPGIESVGVAGSTNVITAPIHIVNERLEVGGSRDISIDGNITYEPDATDMISNAGIRAVSSGITVTINSDMTIVDTDMGEAVDFYFNNAGDALGTLVIDGVISGAGGILYGKTDNSGTGLGTIILKQASTFTGSVRAGRGNLILENANALGTGTYRQEGPANQFGYNLISTVDNLNIPNDITFSQWQSFKGTNSIELSGTLSQTNNRGLINLLPAGETVTLSGRINIWEDEEELDRRFVVEGSGKTIISGIIRNDPLDVGTIEDLRFILKTGTGVLLIDVGPGDNNHQGADIVAMGNLHYANNDSLNTYVNAKIRARGGAVGVDDHPAGQNLATNTAFLNQIDPISVGGLMLSATEDAATNLDFTSGALVNAASMSVAAPETGITYTGTITPANDTYKLGGGTGTLTMPGVQLTGTGRSLEVKNGGTVRLLGDNTYTGATSIITKYTTSRQEQAEVDEASDADGIFYDRLVAPVLEVDDLANGGQASSIGASSSDAANLKIQGSTLRYVGTGDTTNRLFTLGTGGGTLDSSGTGPVTFSNTGALGIPDATDKIGTLDDFTGNPTEIINVSDTSDIVVGMTVSDPDAGGPVATACGGGTSMNCIPAGTTVTGVSDDGGTIGLSSSFGFIWKMDTRLVFGAVDRTLTLTGSNSGANVLSPVIANSAKGGAVNIVKQGTGTWLLEGLNTSTGATTVEAGTLGGNGGVGGNLTVNNGATFAPGGTGTGIGDFSVGGSFTLDTGAILGIQLGGTGSSNHDVLNVTGSATLAGAINLSTVSFNPAINNQFTVLTAAGGISDNGLIITGLNGFTKSIVGNSLVLTKTAALSALASVPEPTALVLIGLGLACVGLRRR